MLKMLDLFSGIGGFSLAADWTGGIETVAFCEIEPYCQKVLRKHWSDVPIYPDIKELKGEQIGSVDIVCGGFPCQPFSVAGKRKGKDDDRYLWPEMLRVISELKPTWVVGENVNGFVNMGLEDACVDLENEGYEVQPFVIPACSIGAWHERKRVFIIAYSKHNGTHKAEIIRKDNGTQQEEQARQELLLNEFKGISSLWQAADINRGTSAVFQNARCELFEGAEQLGALSNKTGKGDANIIKRPSEVVFNSPSKRWQTSKHETRNTSKRETEWESWAADSFNRYIWESEPNVGRVANGIPNRVDRLKALGNSIVPQVAYQILQGIVDIERGLIDVD